MIDDEVEADVADEVAAARELPRTALLAEQAWLRWRAERTYFNDDYDHLMRIAFHAGFARGRYA